MAQYNEDELEPPCWMDKNFLVQVLNNAENDKYVDILEYVFSPGSQRGDHFGSCMFRAALVYKTGNGEEKRKSIIIKTIPDIKGVKKDMLDDSEAFNTEIRIYSKTIPLFEEILKQYGDYTAFGPRMLYASLEPRKVIVFDDLVTLSYTTLKDRMLTFAELKPILQKLAKFHAVSFKVDNEDSESVQCYKKGIFELPDAKNNELFTAGLPTLVQELKNRTGFEEHYLKLDAIKKKVIEKCFESPPTTSFEYEVLTHGDFHMKNMMFKFDESKNITESIILDYQISKFGTPAADLIYALYLVADSDTRYNHRDEYFYYYHTQFVDALNMIEYKGKIPSLRQLLKDVVEYRHFELFIISTFLPFMIMMITAPGDIKYEEVISSTEERNTFYKNRWYLEELKKALPILLHKGYFDDW